MSDLWFKGTLIEDQQLLDFKKDSRSHKILV